MYYVTKGAKVYLVFKIPPYSAGPWPGIHAISEQDFVMYASYYEDKDIRIFVDSPDHIIDLEKIKK